MISFLSEYNLAYITGICLLLACLAYTCICKAIHRPVRLHPFSKEETLPVRGILAFLIVVCHVSCFHEQEGPFIHMLTTFGAAAVSLFFFMSGYGLTYSAKTKGPRYVSSFLRKDLVKLVPPFLVVSFLSIAVSHFFLDRDILNLLRYFLSFMPPLYYSWFVYVLILFYVIFYLVYRFLASTKQWFRILTLFLCTCVIYFVFRKSTDYVFWYISLFAFNVGNIYTSFGNRINTFIEKHKVKALLIVLGLVGTTVALKTRTVAQSFIPLSGVMAVIFFGGGKNIRILNFLGRISYETYLMHGIFVPLYAAFDLNWTALLLAAESSSIIAGYLLHRFFTRKIVRLAHA